MDIMGMICYNLHEVKTNVLNVDCSDMGIGSDNTTGDRGIHK